MCPKCGSIKKSGKRSCCGRGGSWFRNCGSAGNAKLDHTWYEGIQVCKARTQSKRASGQQSNAAQQLKPMNASEVANSKTVIRPVKTFVFTSSNTPTIASTPNPVKKSIIRLMNDALKNISITTSEGDTDTVGLISNVRFHERYVSESALLSPSHLHALIFIYIILFA